MDAEQNNAPISTAGDEASAIAQDNKTEITSHLDRIKSLS
jgi:hypothetical protein